MNFPFSKKNNPAVQTQAASPAPNTQQQAATQLGQGMVSVKDVIAPSAIEVDFDYLKIGNTYFRTLFVAGYPRYVAANWLSPLINFDS
jgi:conjugal transfer ATP-binding protein TraC